MIRIALVLGLAMALACGPQREPATAGPDAQSLAAVARIETRLRSRAPVSDTDLDQLRVLHTRFPSEPRIRAALQGVLVGRGDWDGLVALEFDSPGRARSARDELFLAKLYVKLGRYAEAARILEPMAVPDTSAQVARIAGQALFYTGHYARASALLERAARGLPPAEAAEAMTLRGLAALHSDSLETAERALRRALTLAPDSRPAHVALGRVLAAGAHDQEARTHFDRAAALQAATTATERRAGTLVSQSHELTQARTAHQYRDAEEIIRNMLPLADVGLQSQLYKALAEVLQKDGRPEEASAAAARGDSLARKQAGSS